jgi:hypothetical protein
LALGAKEEQYQIIIFLIYLNKDIVGHFSIKEIAEFAISFCGRVYEIA